MRSILRILRCLRGHHETVLVRVLAFYDHEGGKYFNYEEVCKHCGHSHSRPIIGGPPIEWEYEDRLKIGTAR